MSAAVRRHPPGGWALLFLLLGLCLHLRGCATLPARPAAADPVPGAVWERLEPGLLWAWSGNACLLAALVLLLLGLSRRMAARREAAARRAAALALEARRSRLRR